MIRPPGINNGAFVVSPDTVWYARVCFCSQHLLWLTLQPSPSNAHSYRRWKHTTILRMVNIISLISIKIIICVILIILFRLAGICRFPSPLRARLQETYSLHPRWKHPGETACNSCRWHRNHSAQHVQPFSWRARRPPGGFRGRMEDVVCQFVGFRLVPQYVMKADGVEALDGSECGRDRPGFGGDAVSQKLHRKNLYIVVQLLG